MQERDTLLDALLGHLDSWVGDIIASEGSFRCNPHAATLAESTNVLMLALLRTQIKDAARVRVLRRLLASMLPTDDTDAGWSTANDETTHSPPPP